MIVKEELAVRTLEDADGEGVEEFVGDDEGFETGGLERFGEIGVPITFVDGLLARGKMGGDFDKTVVEFSSGQPRKVFTNVGGESAITGAEFDDGKAFTLPFPGVLDPF